MSKSLGITARLVHDDPQRRCVLCSGGPDGLIDVGRNAYGYIICDDCVWLLLNDALKAKKTMSTLQEDRALLAVELLDVVAPLFDKRK